MGVGVGVWVGVGVEFGGRAQSNIKGKLDRIE